ncbi:MAG: arginine repressor [Vicinamibacterales bacterium]
MPIDQAILEIVSREQIGDQRALLARLAERGFRLTQSALSRRLHRLQVRKQNGVYTRAAGPPAAMPPFRLALAPPNLVVLRTEPGFAQALALVVDRANPPGFAGSVAGDDTVLFAASAPEALVSLFRSIETLLGAG